MTHYIGQIIFDIILLYASLFQIAFMHLMMKYSSFPPNIKCCNISPDFFLSSSTLVGYHIGYGLLSVNAFIFSKYPMREYVMILNLVGLLLFYAEFMRLRNRRQLANERQNLQNIQVSNE